MKTKRNLMLAASIISYVFAALYMVVTALYFSVRENIYWLYLVFSLLSLYTGLYVSTLRNKVDEHGQLEKKYFISYIVFTVISVLQCPACILNLIALLYKGEDKYLLVENPAKAEPKVKKEKKWYKKSSFILVLIGLCGVIVSSFSAMTFETSGYTVQVSDFTLDRAKTLQYNNGAENRLLGNNFVIANDDVSFAVTEYRPKSASHTNLLPVVFVLPGFTRTKATMSQYAIELSRRGAVVFTIDPGSQGASTYGGWTYDADGNITGQVSYNDACDGLDYLVQYVYNNTDDFTYIDRDRFGAIGHSAGGGDVSKLCVDYAGSTYAESIIKAAYISGYIKSSAANRFKNIRSNLALSYAYYDEGAFRYQDSNTAYEYVALKFINDVNGADKNSYTSFTQDFDYGSFVDGTYRIIHHEMINHCFEMYDPVSIANTTNFFRRALAIDTDIDDASQTWFGKEASNGLALVFAFIFIFSLLFFVIDFIPFLRRSGERRREEEQQIKDDYKKELKDGRLAAKKNKTFLDKVLFWTPMVLTAIIACLDYIPLARLTMDWFPDAAGNIYTYYFPARMMNAVFLWAIFNGAIGLILWAGVPAIENLVRIIYSKVTGKENTADWSRFKGLKVNWRDLLVSLGLAVVLFFTFYGLLQLMYITMHQDFRFTLISASPLQPRFLMTWLIYLAGFLVFYLSNSIRVNLSIGREGWSEWKVLLVGGIANSIGLVFILVINYFVYFKTGTVYYGYYSAADTSEMWLYVNMVFGLIPMMFLLPILNRIIYRKSGNVYLGAVLVCMIFIMMSLSASISFIPM